MPGCSGTSCNCSIEVGAGLSLDGSGSLENPFVISLAGGIEDSLVVEDSLTIDLILNGGGSPVDPYRLSATAKLRVVDLTDVIDPEGTPDAGDTLVYVTEGFAVPRWEFRPPPPNPAGAVNIGVGLAGDGTLGTPLRVQMIGTSQGGTTSGLEVYEDSAGNLRAVTPVVSAVSWASITGKPTTFPTTPADFTGTLPEAKGGTGQTALSLVTVGNSTKVDGHRVFVQSATPSGAAANDLWFWG